MYKAAAKYDLLTAAFKTLCLTEIPYSLSLKIALIFPFPSKKAP